MRIKILLVIGSIFLFQHEAFGRSAAPGGRHCTGIWASAAQPPYDEKDLAPRRVISPNGKASVILSSHGLAFVDSQGSESYLDILATPPLVEVVWSPDSEHFAINSSDGGIVGTWDTKVYAVNKTGLHPLEHIFDKLRPVANQIQRCNSKEEVNFGSASWINGGKELLVVTEVPPHGSCQNMGAITGFRISTDSGAVIERMPDKKLRSKWKSALGCRFGR